MINKSRLINLTQKLISINSVNPPGNELKIARFIEKYCKSRGLNVKTVSYAKDRPNVIATLSGSLPREKAAAQSLLLTPHIDTVPFGRGWKHRPLGGEMLNGKIYGRGATDDKGNLAAAMEAIESLVEDGVKLQKDIILAATVDEESGSQQGIIPLLKEKLLKPKFAIVLDSDEFDCMVVQKGLLHLKVQIFGQKAHGAYNWRGINAIEFASDIIHDLKRIKFRHKSHRLLKKPTINIGTIQGGDKVNMVADFCEFSVDCRFLPGMNPAEVKRRIENVIKKKAKKYKIIVENMQYPYEVDAAHPGIDTFIRTARKFGCKASVKGCEGATVMTFFKKYRIPAFATGFGAHNTAHKNDEYIYVKSLFDGAKVLEEYIKQYDQLII